VPIFKLNPQAGQPLYMQLMEQIRHALDTGVLRPGDQLPGIRTLAEEMVVSHNTVAKAYSELEHDGVLELRQGSGAFILPRSGSRVPSGKIRKAQSKVRALVEALRQEDLSEEEIRRLFEAELLYQDQQTTGR
jgi:GntR family transcriptional regulator